VAARAPAERRGELVAYTEAAATAGIVAGPFVGGVVTTAAGVRPTFLGVAAVLCVLLVWTGLEPEVRVEEHRRTTMRVALTASLQESLIWASLVMILVVAVVGAALQLLVPLHLAGAGLDRSGIGLVYSVGAVAGGVAVVVSGRVGDRIGRVPLAAGACAALALLTALFALPTTVAAFVVLVVAATATQSILYAVGYPLSADGADRAQIGHGVVLGVVNLAWGLGAVVGPVAGSRIAGWQGPRASYAVLAALCVVTTLVFIVERAARARSA